MINTICGSMGSLKSEITRSDQTSGCSKAGQPTSPTASVSESNNLNVASSSDVEKNNKANNNNNNNNHRSASVSYQSLKFGDEEVDVEVQSPDNSIWESLIFSDEIESGVDFMISSPRRWDLLVSSPRRSGDLMMSSPKRGDLMMISSPKRGDWMLISSPKRGEYMISSPKRGEYMISSPKRGEYMISSPKRGEYMISSPKRGEYMISSPKRREYWMISSPKRQPLPHQPIQNNIHAAQNSCSPYSQTQQQHYEQQYCLPGSSLPACPSTAPFMGHCNYTKGKMTQSPLHKVAYNSSQHDNQSFMRLPSSDPFLDDYTCRDEYGVYPTSTTPTKMTNIIGSSMSSEAGAFDPSKPINPAGSMLDYIAPIQAGRLYGSVMSGVGADSRDVPLDQMINHNGDHLGYASTSQQQLQELLIQHGSQQQQQHQTTTLEQGLASEREQEDQDSGLQLVHLLLACAEAVAKEDYMMAKRYLHHLNRVLTPLGDSMQRVAAYFTEALSTRLTAALTAPTSTSSSNSFPSNPYSSPEVLKIYQILYQSCPYIKFAHFTANQAIFEAFESEDRVHVIDLDILQGYQWPAFMQALAARPGGAPFLRITGVGSPFEAVRETGRQLTDLAQSLQVPFAFHPVGERLEDLQPHMFHRRVGEALAVNSVNRLHRVPGSYLGNLLSMIRDQAPNIVILVEQEASHNGPYFLGRFLEALHYYSAIFDSLDATFPADSLEREKVERFIFGPEIGSIVACEGPERRERHERLEKWRKIMEGKGFKGVPLSANAVTQSKILLGLYPCDGYSLKEDKGCLLLGWQDRSLIAASAWRC